MPEIGPTLRETRIRAGLEISDIEASTKIRAKYLRAIENEEWDLLPGPTFAKTFLRTYAETLELDSRLLLEEYKARYERYDEHDLRPVPRTGATTTSTGRTSPRGHSGGRGGSRGGRRGGGGRGSGRPWLIVVGLIVIVGVVLFAFGVGRNDGGDKGAATTATPPVTNTTGAAADVPPATTERTTSTDTAAKTTVRLQIVPSGSVYACLTAGSKRLIDGQVLDPASPPGTFRSRRFLLALGNGDAKLKIDGKTYSVASTGKPVGYEITPDGRTRLRPSQLPQCG